MFESRNLAAALLGCSLVLPGSIQAASFVTTGQTVGGTTIGLSTSTSAVTNDTDLTLTNDGSGNLVVSINTTTANTDWFVTWTGLTSLGIDTSTYRYVQIDIASVSTGLVSSNWQTFFQDDDSTIGGTTNSGQNVGIAPVNSTPYSLVIDMTGGTGSQAWGQGTLDHLRFDMYESTATNKGESFTISGITLGTALVPEPGSLVLLGLGGLLSLRRRRR